MCRAGRALLEPGTDGRGHASPKVEEYVTRKLGLKAAPVSTQVVQRDVHAEFVTALALTAASLEQFATEVRALQKTETLEAEEPFKKGVVYYMDDSRVRGVLLWNVWDKVEDARALMKETGPFKEEDLKGKIK